MVVPAMIYAALNAGGDGARGWGIPMATDIAFAVGALALLGTRVPSSLKVFLLALAIVDDIGAIVVIAVFYTDDVALGWLGAAFAVVLVGVACAAFDVRSAAVYLVLAMIAWLAVHESGVHATIAGVLMALVVPVRYGDRASPSSLIDQSEHLLHPWTSYLVVPLFALANAGVDLAGGLIGDSLSSRVSLGVLLGLIVGKPLGIVAGAFLAVRIGFAAPPRGVGWREIAGVGLLGGIGFTVSLFIAELAFDDPALTDEAKIGMLAGSALAAIAGYLVLWWRSSPRASE